MEHSLQGARGRRTLSPEEKMNMTSTKDFTINNKRTRIIGGTLVAEPFKTAVPPQRPDVAGFYGNINRMINPPNAERISSYKFDYNNITRTAQSAGTVHKRPVPFSVNAPRNRLAEPQYKPERNGTSHFKLEANGVVNRTNYRFRTTKQIAEMPIHDGPLSRHVGFTNGFVVSELTKRYHKPMFR